MFLVVDIYKIDLRNDRLAFKEAGEVVNVRFGIVIGDCGCIQYAIVSTRTPVFWVFLGNQMER